MMCRSNTDEEKKEKGKEKEIEHKMVGLTGTNHNAFMLPTSTNKF
jgi:hypothetical protein